MITVSTVNVTIIENQRKFDKIIWIEIRWITNSQGALSQKINILINQTFYSDGTKMSNFYDDSTFKPDIALYVPIFIFLFAIFFNYD